MFIWNPEKHSTNQIFWFKTFQIYIKIVIDIIVIKRFYGSGQQFAITYRIWLDLQCVTIATILLNMDGHCIARIESYSRYMLLIALKLT